jgi:hypothetical protein
MCGGSSSNPLVPNHPKKIDVKITFTSDIYRTSSLAFKIGPQIEMEKKVFKNHFLIDRRPDSISPRVN